MIDPILGERLSLIDNKKGLKKDEKFTRRFQFSNFSQLNLNYENTRLPRERSPIFLSSGWQHQLAPYRICPDRRKGKR
jgi:hypothetical protein